MEETEQEEKLLLRHPTMTSPHKVVEAMTGVIVVFLLFLPFVSDINWTGGYVGIIVGVALLGVVVQTMLKDFKEMRESA